MALGPGTSLGPYEIVAPIGQGGMGEVWKAYDPKLQRTVAIKVLTDQAEDAASRILAEARAASALNHPHICTIHDVGEADGESFIVMEHVEGKPLGELIPSDGLPPESVIRYGTQIADALAHAHEHGIVHRDLKSANVVITPEAQVKLIDFGIAVPLASADADAVTKTMESPVRSAPVGTLAYMAPEVLNGEEATARSDIWSLGVLLYEMASGRQPFEGETPLDVVSAIAKDSPRALPSRVSAGFRSVVQRCLQKEAGSRYAGVMAVQAALEAVQSDSGVTHRASTVAFEGFQGRRIATVAVVVALAIAFGYWLRPQPRGGVSGPPRFANPMQITSAIGVEDYAAWSPDTRTLAYTVTESTRVGMSSDIWVVSVGGGPPVNRTADHPGHDSSPSWSRDGSQIAFYSDRDGGGYFIMSAVGGPARKIISGGSRSNPPQWSPDGDELAGVEPQSGDDALEIVSLRTRASRRVTLEGKRSSRNGVSWSSDGRFLAYVVGAVSNEVHTLRVLRLVDGQNVAVTDGLTEVRSPGWSPDGRFLYFVSNRGGNWDLWQQPMNSDGTPDGDPRGVTVGVGMRHAAFSPDGTKLVYSQGRLVANVWRVPILDDRVATWADAEQMTFDQAFIEWVDVSPDAAELMVGSNRGGNPDLWMSTVAI